MFLEREAITGEIVSLAPDDAHHLCRVVRLRPGDPLEVCDGQGRVWRARLDTPGSVRLIEGPEAREPPLPLLHVLQALPKGRKIDEVIQSLVELGIERLTPVAAERSVVRLTDEKRERAHRRWMAVARAAAAQSRRAWLPVVSELLDVEAAAASLDDPHIGGIVAHVGASTSLAAGLAALPPGTSEVAVAIGPEGGWAESEVECWRRSGLEAVTLGPSVLRTEHAAFAACAAIAYATGRM
ncbi:MAG: 16S rRNA (uracil(1498)-N(3))-methyltransferase [Actinomycetota bacterium]|nr:16S rRNA (uracil(1498)-N(3))-methyltransferase [Actinomycetota bacterium]